METKVCTKCGKELPIEYFNWRNKEKNTRRSECKFCHSKFMKQNNQDKRNKINGIKRNAQCAKCGESREWCLDFHHIVPSDKEDTIARMISNNYKIDKTLEEIKKCVCLCSNCHRDFHYLKERDGITIEEYLLN